MTDYTPTIGLEIHAELTTRTKMFCDSKNDPDEKRPNVNICPVCMAHPGALPTINREAVAHVLRVGAALGGRLADYTEFDRKNYFYPDLPKGYQISQYEFPLVSGGELSGVAITRVHLEEDTASSVHDAVSGSTTIDFNRSGIPLMELVTEPVISDAATAGKFARELQLLLRALGASEANMEKGEMRVEANVSVSARTGLLGTKVEIKNLNSFRAMERAVAHEIARQTMLLDRGERVIQETRGWDETKQETFRQRTKEGSADYRYFPDPDLPSLKLSELSWAGKKRIEETLPELPEDRRVRYIRLGAKPEDAELYLRDPRLGAFFEEVVSGYPAASRELAVASNYIANDLVRIIRDKADRETEYSHEIPISARNFKKIINMVVEGKISSRGAKDILSKSAEANSDPDRIAAEGGFLQSEAVDVESAVRRVISAHQNVVSDYKAGKETALEYLVGQGMKELRGAADPVALREILKRELG